MNGNDQTMEPSEYDLAVYAHNAAMHKYHAIRDQYRARQVDDDVFLAAAAEYKKATDLFDKAFAIEAGWN